MIPQFDFFTRITEIPSLLLYWPSHCSYRPMLSTQGCKDQFHTIDPELAYSTDIYAVLGIDKAPICKGQTACTDEDNLAIGYSKVSQVKPWQMLRSCNYVVMFCYWEYQLRITPWKHHPNTYMMISSAALQYVGFDWEFSYWKECHFPYTIQRQLKKRKDEPEQKPDHKQWVGL